MSEEVTHFIIDASALTKGLGNIKKWMVDDVELFIPSYTIHELDYLKKGITMIATNARESVRFIEKVVSSDDETINTKLILESPADVGPNWKKCMTYKVRSPKVHEFPNAKPASTSTVKSIANQPNTIKYEHETSELSQEKQSAQGSLNKQDRNARRQRAEIPARYKYLIRPCIKKTYLDDEDWKLITEDETTKIWCESFGIKCISITEAESVLFHKKNSTKVDSAYLFDDLSLEDSRGMRTVFKSSNGKNRRLATGKSDIKFKDGNTHLESYDAISYAPRGSGELWAP